jgi:OmpA-OmpF porin, OOP family
MKSVCVCYERSVSDTSKRRGFDFHIFTSPEDASKPVDKTTWFTFDRLEFETGSTDLNPSSAEQLKNIAEILKAHPKVGLKIGGYTDNTGNPDANLKLSQKRAESTMQEHQSRR